MNCLTFNFLQGSHQYGLIYKGLSCRLKLGEKPGGNGMTDSLTGYIDHSKHTSRGIYGQHKNNGHEEG